MADPRIIERIKALLAKTTENGCTEAEALAAMEKARDLMDKHQIEQGELGAKAEGVIRAFSERVARGHIYIKDYLSAAIGKYCDCEVWLGADKKIVFLGLRSDADFATWLLDSLDHYVRNSVIEYMVHAAFAVSTRSRRWEIEKDFIFGAIGRINERLEAMIQSRRRNADGGSRALIITKNALIQQALSDLGIRLRSSQGSAVTFHKSGAFEAGVRAGSAASFGRPVGGSSGQRLIGGGR